MLQSITVALERNTVISGAFATEPYEVAWAREARWYIRPLRFEGDDFEMAFRTETSPDGIHWCPLEDSVHTLRSPDMLTWAVRDFGGWLRIRGDSVGNGTGASMKAIIYLSLKS